MAVSGVRKVGCVVMTWQQPQGWDPLMTTDVEHLLSSTLGDGDVVER